MSNTCKGCMISGCGIFDNNGCSCYEPSPLLTARIHYVKILPEFFKAVTRGDKTFEIQKDDRDYRVGDYVVLREWTHQYGFSADYQVVYITYILGREKLHKSWVRKGDIVFSMELYSVNRDEREWVNNEMKRLDNGEDTGMS